MEQWPQSHPQEFFPSRFCRIRYLIMKITITIKREEIRIVARFDIIQLIIMFALLWMTLGKREIAQTLVESLVASL